MPEELSASPLLRWPETIANREAQQAVADRAVEQMRDGQLIGIGSGSSAFLLLQAIGRRVRTEQLTVAVVCASFETETAASTLGLSQQTLGSGEPDWGVDSADEIDGVHRLLKARGGAPLQHKLLWSTTKRMLLAVEPSAHVTRLGETLALPVEVHRDGVTLAARELTRLGAAEVTLRVSAGKDGPVITASGNLVLDARFPEIPPGLDAEIKLLPGVIETGLFEGYTFETL